MKISFKKQNQRIKAFSIIEILVVVFIISISATSLALTSQTMVLANQRLRYTQDIQVQAQKATQHFSKIARMSSSVNENFFTQDHLGLMWRKAKRTEQYTIQKIPIVFYCGGSLPTDPSVAYNPDYSYNIENYFSDNLIIDCTTFQISGGGINHVNRATISFTVRNKTNDPALEVEVPVQVTVSFRSDYQG
jgi:type II secretory pathway pseudopilin PulG